MTDWAEAGRKADAHRIRALYREGFQSEAKQTVRARLIKALQVAGATICLDLWGGGASADELVRVGLDVISIDDGSFEVIDKGHPVSAERKRRALEYAAREGGYTAGWGHVAKYAMSADGAFLDFCGPWSRGVRRSIEACRHMKAVVVTLMTDHDTTTDATSQSERRLAYEAYMRNAFRQERDRPVYLRRLCSYKRETGQPVFVYLLSPERLDIPKLTTTERYRLDPDQRRVAYELHRNWNKSRDYWRSLPPERKIERLAKANAYKTERRAKDPAYAAHIRQLNRESAARKRAADPVAARHLNHVKRQHRRYDCPLCRPAESIAAETTGLDTSIPVTESVP